MPKKAAKTAKKSQAKGAMDTAETAVAQALLPKIVEAFLASPTGQLHWNATKLGKQAVGDPNRIFEMRDGAALMPKTAEKILGVIDSAAPGFCKKFVRQQMRGA